MIKYKLNFNYLNAFKKLQEIQRGTIICMGGRGGGKSISASKLAIEILLKRKNARGLLIRDEAVRVKDSILNDVKTIAKQVDEATNFEFSKWYAVQDNGIKNLKTKEDAVFTIGLKSSTNEQTAKLKSLSNVNFVIVEEAEDIKDETSVKKLRDTLIRFKDAIIIFLLNTPNKEHWLLERYFDLQKSDYPGYWQPVPKDLPDVHYFIVNYDSNEKLSEAAKQQYANYGNPEHPDYDLDWYCHQILGLVPETSLNRAIITRTYKVSWRDVDDIPYTINHGWLRSQLTLPGRFFLCADGGMHTTHSALVFGYTVEKYDRDILLAEFYNKQGHEGLRELSLQFKEFAEHHHIKLAELQIVADPALKTYGDDEFIKEILGKQPDMLEVFQESDEHAFRMIFQYRLEKRLARTSGYIYQMCSDNLPKFIILKDKTADTFAFGCPNLYEGLFKGKWRRAEKNGLEGKVIVKDLEQIPPITDLCDGYSYHVLRRRPVSRAEAQSQNLNLKVVA